MFKYLIIFISLFCVQNIFATTDGPDYYRVVRVKKGDFLYVRAKPSANAKVLGKIPSNTRGIENTGVIWPPYYADCPPDKEILKDRNDLTEEEKAVLLKGDLWLKIKYKHIIGWVKSKYLTEDAQTSSLKTK
jgi:uncharacterized protein YgiM (DUF1202 family)